MYACFSYKDGSQGDAIWVNPEDLAVATSPEELEILLRTKAKTEFPEKKDKIQDCELEFMIPLFMGYSEFMEKTVEEFWSEYSSYFPEWIKIGEKIKKRLKEYEGKDTYWEINPSVFVIEEKPIMDQNDWYNFRISLITGNCFPTKEKAEKFLENLVEEFKIVHEHAGTTDEVEANWTLSASETIHNWCWSCWGYMTAPVWPSIYICPMNIKDLKEDKDDENDQVQRMRRNWNVFGDLEPAIEACEILQAHFERNGFLFPPIMENTECYETELQ